MDKAYFTDMEGRIPTGEVRTRFAPSPTGYMHVGNLRTAIYTYLIAKSRGGRFILRIEDTDQERYVEGATDLIYRTLGDTGLRYDEGPDVGGPVGPYIQSERREIYQNYARLLIETGGAYRCFCTREDMERRHPGEAHTMYDGHCAGLSEAEIAQKLAEGVPYVVRQKMPKTGSTTFHDEVFGDITVENSALDDGVLIKSDGLPTYNFANVVDDHLMGITHVVRGSEYLSSAPKYNLLYKSFGWEVPVYIHCSPVMKNASEKLSKRHGDASYEDLLDLGFIKEAIINYVALLGWSPGGEREKYTLDELAGVFSVSGISKSPAIFDRAKLEWLNGEYIHELPEERFLELATPYLRQSVKNEAYDIRAIARLVQSRCQVLTDLPERVDFFDALPDYSIELYTHKKMKTNPENALTSLQWAREALGSLAAWDQEAIHGALIALAETHEVKNGVVLWPVRVALSGKALTPGGGVELALILGKDETLRRIDAGIAKLQREG